MPLSDNNNRRPIISDFSSNWLLMKVKLDYFLRSTQLWVLYQYFYEVILTTLLMYHRLYEPQCAEFTDWMTPLEWAGRPYWINDSSIVGSLLWYCVCSCVCVDNLLCSGACRSMLTFSTLLCRGNRRSLLFFTAVGTWWRYKVGSRCGPVHPGMDGLIDEWNALVSISEVHWTEGWNTGRRMRETGNKVMRGWGQKRREEWKEGQTEGLRETSAW